MYLLLTATDTCFILATGFAVAVQPISAKAITTDVKGLVAEVVKIPVRDGEITAYRTMPSTGKDFPIVLVIQEIFSVHEHVQDVCRALPSWDMVRWSLREPPKASHLTYSCVKTMF